MIFNYGGGNLPFDPNSIIGSHTNYSYTPQQQAYQPQQQQQLLPQLIGQLSMQQQPQQQSYQPQALQQMSMQQQSYRPLPQAPTMQPLLRQLLTQQQPYQEQPQQQPYQGQFSYQQQSDQMSPNTAMGSRSGSAYGSGNELLGRINNLAPFNKNALSFGF
jgi:hypothetical protein